MRALIQKLTSNLILPIGWSILTVVLLILPGSAFPGKGFFSIEIPFFDKIIHLILFGVLVGLWCQYYFSKSESVLNLPFKIIMISLMAIALGIIMEFVQRNFVANRSFDIGDIAANTTSAVLCGSFYYLRSKSRRVVT